jgi:[ribosomal protein S5]-alanine N-acetyltransferase
MIKSNINILNLKKQSLETKRLLLIPFSLKYKDFFYNCSKSEIITKYTTIIGSIEKPTMTDVEKYIKRTKRFKNGMFYVILLKENKAPIGCIGINQIDLKNKTCSTFSWLSPEFVSNGFVFEAKMKIFEIIFNKLKLNRIETHCDTNNKKIIKHLFSLGFKKEGRLRESYVSKGKFVDDYIFSLLKKEYKRLRC